VSDELIEGLATYTFDPYGFALWAFPWGEPGSPLEFRTLEGWQIQLLCDVRDGLLTPEEAIRLARVSGNGVGKSALVSIIILWAMSTFEDTKGVITANTETQLKTKTWAELGKWFNMFIARDLFRLTATALFSRDPDRERTWRIDMVPWSEHNIVAFQGLHNEGKRLLIIFDEASGIADGIHEAADGCMTDANTQRIWLMFGNPNAPTGRFREAFPGGRFAARWGTAAIDSRTVSFTDKQEAQNWVDDYGEDSDFVRIRVRGVFPRAGTIQFIGVDLVRAATQRDVDVHVFDPLVIGVDVARFGDDESVIFFRKGRDGRTIPPVRLRNVDTMTLAAKAAEAYLSHKADGIFVDGGGVGGGVVDRLRQLRIPVIEVQFGAASDNNFGVSDTDVGYANKRAEIWGATKEWLKGGALPHLADLEAGLTGPEYGFKDIKGRSCILLEAKDSMKKRGLASPDLADALALTFAYPVVPLPAEVGTGTNLMRLDYDPIETALAEAS
jgi:hypothetical protein